MQIAHQIGDGGTRAIISHEINNKHIHQESFYLFFNFSAKTKEKMETGGFLIPTSI
jgi:hypothetical protein